MSGVSQASVLLGSDEDNTGEHIVYDTGELYTAITVCRSQVLAERWTGAERVS